MRLLLVDSGNSRIKWGLHEEGDWLARETLETSEVDVLRAAFAGIARPTGIVVANVAGQAVADAIARSLAALGPEPYWVVGSAAQCGVRSSYADPAQLGPDRWAALIGARHLHPGACIVVNAGTTMTVDALSADGVFVGGCIVAGKRLMHEALASNTARLALQDGRFSFFPDNTGDSIASGALNALAGAVDRMVRYLSDAGENAVTTLVSGGDAALLAPVLTAPRLVDNLVLEGLLRIGESGV